MGTYGCDDFITYLTLELGNLGNITAYDDLWVNAGYNWLTSRKDLYFPELEWKAAASVNTADGTAYIDTTSDVLYVQGVLDTTNGQWLEKIHPREYFKFTDRATAAAEDKPTRWTHVAGGSNRGYIYLYPTPDAIYAMTRYYRALPTALTGTATTVIGTEWDEVILKAAVWLARMRLNQFDRAKEDKATLDEMIKGIKGLYDRENIDMEEGVIPHPSWHPPK
jgi:hypothetical protein